MDLLFRKRDLDGDKDREISTREWSLKPWVLLEYSRKTFSLEKKRSCKIEI